jgi:hypothetical protein
MEPNEIHAIAEGWTRALLAWTEGSTERAAPSDWRRVMGILEDILRWTAPSGGLHRFGVVDFGSGPSMVFVTDELLVVEHVAGYVGGRDPEVAIETAPLARDCCVFSVNLQRDASAGPPRRLTTWRLGVRAPVEKVYEWRSEVTTWDSDDDAEAVGRAIATRLGWPMPRIDRQAEERAW